MKKIALSIVVALANIIICHAQELTLEVVPGKLASQLTKEQKQTVTDLILTGSLNKEDFYFMRDSLPKLRNANLKHTEVDTIPAQAFYDKDMNTILLPLELKYIDEDAFSTQNISNNMSVYVTGKYPGRTAYIIRDKKWNTHRNKYLKIDKDNKELIVNEYQMVFSANGKSLYNFGEEKIHQSHEFNEGLEVIESYAFMNVELYGHYIFPSTLKEIKKHAFYHFEGTFPIGGSTQGNSFVLKTKIPPVLGEETFVLHSDYIGCYLIVPEGCSETYKNADPQWNIFDGIVEGDEPLPPVANQSLCFQNFSITRNELNLQLSGEQIIKKIEVYNTLGHLIYSQKYNNRTIEIPCMPSESILIIKVYDEKGEVETLKLNNHF